VDLSAGLAADVPRLRPAWGVSAAHRGVMSLADAYEEAETATRALRHINVRRVSFYSELGILRLMLADPGSTDLARFVTETVPSSITTGSTGRACWRRCTPTSTPGARSRTQRPACSSTPRR
jgi:hypothetical protein